MPKIRGCLYLNGDKLVGLNYLGMGEVNGRQCHNRYNFDPLTAIGQK